MIRRLSRSVLIVLASITAAVGQQKVMVMKIRAEIDPRVTRYVDLALAHATDTKADIVILELDTYGGTLTDAREITEKLLAFPKPLWVFINSDAASAGALISIACDSIYMTPGASIGAATVVNGSDGTASPDKYQSYMRSIMRSTAETNKRDPRIAEGMVDERIVIDSVKQAGKVITFTTDEAIAANYCEGKVSSIQDILDLNKVKEPVIEHYDIGFLEKVIAFFLNPVISGLLILIFVAGIYFEMQSPGIGFALLAAAVALVLYLVPYYLNGLAAYWEIIVLFIGIILIFLEVFVIPGFGVAGISGIALTLISMVLIMLNNDFFNFEFIPFGDIVTAMMVTAVAIVGGMLFLFFGGNAISNTRAFKRVALTTTMDSAAGYTVNAGANKLTGRQGTAHTVLRPSGKIMIDDQVYDAFTRGEFIDRGEIVEVIATEGVTLKVKKV